MRKNLSVFLFAVFMSITAFAQLPPLPNFTVGYNEGWFGRYYGTDLTTDFDITRVNRVFDGIAKGGGYVVRLWLFENRQGLVLGSSGAPELQGLVPTLIPHLKDVLASARARGLRVYLTLLNANEMPSDSGPLRDYYYNLLNNKYGEGDAFNTGAVGPVLELLNENQDLIYGLDLMNEIEPAILHGFWINPIGGPREWIRRTVSFVKQRSPWLKVTVSTGWNINVAEVISGLFSGLGLDFYDIHIYSDSGSYTGATALCKRAEADGVFIILGEFGQNTQDVDDQMQETSTATFLSTAQGMCFKAAFAWRFDSEEHFWHYQRPDGSMRPAAQLIKNLGRED